MSPFENKLIKTERHSNHVAILSLNRPEKRNALNDEMFQQLQVNIQELETDDDIRVVVITGTAIGEKRFFSAGIDLSEILQGIQHDDSTERLMQKAKEWQDIYTRIARSPIPFICAIDGVCYGAGLELALACDLRVAAEDATLGLLETRLGIVADLGGTTRLTRLIGPAKAKRLIFLSEIITGTQAQQLGLVDWLATKETGTALDLALEIANQIAANGPLAVRTSKRLINESLDVSEEQSLASELNAQSQLLETQDAMEGFMAALEKRNSRFKGN